MSVDIRIKDGHGTSNLAAVTANLAVRTTETPPNIAQLKERGELHLLAPTRVLADKLKNSSGSSDQVINGATTPTEFYISANSSEMRVITQARFVIHGSDMSITTAEARKYGNSFGSGLTNGIRFFARQGGAETDIFIDPVKEIQHYYNYQDDLVNDVSAVAVGIDLLAVTINLPDEVVLVPGSQDRLVVLIQDNLTLGSDILKHETLVYGRKVVL